MVTIASFIRGFDGKLVPVADYSGPVSEVDYLEGAIELVVSGTPIVTTAEVDYVFQLWSYLARMIADLRQTGAASTYFPDQAIRLGFERSGPRVVVTCVLGAQTRQAATDLAEFVTCVRDAGNAFFAHLAQVAPEGVEAYEDALGRLNG